MYLRVLAVLFAIYYLDSKVRTDPLSFRDGVSCLI